MLLDAEPAARLVEEAVLVVVDPHGPEIAFAKIIDFIPCGRAFARDEIHLIVAIEMVLVGPVADGLALQ